MASQVFTLEAAKAAKITVIENGRYTQAVHDVVTAIRANGRSGTAKTKTRGEVAGSNKKIYRQKGTGNARAGEKRSPTRVGGGTAHGPKIRDYSKKVSKKTKRVALRKALSARILAGDVFIVDSFTVATPKTKDFVKLITSLSPEPKTLIVAKDFDSNTKLAARNVQPAQLITSGDVNTEHLLLYKKIVLTNDALTQLAERINK